MSKLEPTRTYSNPTATDILRRMLDERGVFWVDIPRKDMTRTVWKEIDGQLGYCYFDENEYGVTTLLVSSPTPEQAIAATLGRGECHEVMINRHWRGCSECGYVWENMYAAGFQIGPNYCPMCGAKVVD